MTDDVSIPVPNYGANSHKAKLEKGAATPRKVKPVQPESSDKAERPKVERVTTSAPVERKKSRFAEAFSGDDIRSVRDYVIFEVFFPAAKNMFSDAVSQGVERLLFGESRPRSSTIGRTGYTPYNRASSGTSVRRDDTRSLNRQARATHDFREVVIADRLEAEEVIDGLQVLVDQFDAAAVSDFYELVGITGSFTDNKWGWTDLRSAKVRRVRDGYLVDLPRPISLD